MITSWPYICTKGRGGAHTSAKVCTANVLKGKFGQLERSHCVCVCVFVYELARARSRFYINMQQGNGRTNMGTAEHSRSSRRWDTEYSPTLCRSSSSCLCCCGRKCEQHDKGGKEGSEQSANYQHASIVMLINFEVNITRTRHQGATAAAAAIDTSVVINGSQCRCLEVSSGVRSSALQGFFTGFDLS